MNTPCSRRAALCSQPDGKRRESGAQVPVLGRSKFHPLRLSSIVQHSYRGVRIGRVRSRRYRRPAPSLPSSDLSRETGSTNSIFYSMAHGAFSAPHLLLFFAHRLPSICPNSSHLVYGNYLSFLIHPPCRLKGVILKNLSRKFAGRATGLTLALGNRKNLRAIAGLIEKLADCWSLAIAVLMPAHFVKHCSRSTPCPVFRRASPAKSNTTTPPSCCMVIATSSRTSSHASSECDGLEVDTKD